MKKSTRCIVLYVLIVFTNLSTCGIHAQQDSLHKTIARDGEGIYALLRREGFEPGQSYAKFIELNKTKLRNGKGLYKGRTYLLPKAAEISVLKPNTIPQNDGQVLISEPLFGKDQNLFQIKDKTLENAIYYLISGHGGPDPGAIARYGCNIIAEDEYAYDLTLRLAKFLMESGAQVYIIIRDPNDGIREERVLKPDQDEVAYPDLAIPLNQKERLQQRTDIVNTLYKKNKGKYQRLIVTHVDSRSSGQNIDVFFYHHRDSRNGKRLSRHIHETFIKKYKEYQPGRTYSGTFEDRSSLYVVNKTLPAMTFIEIGNIQNKEDQRRILDPDNRQALAKWIGEGITEDYLQRNKQD